MQPFKNLKEVLSYFSDEKVCWNYLEQTIWKGKPVCPHCGCEKVYRLKNHKQFKCGNKKTCDKKFTVITGTIYQNTRTSLQNWMAAIWLTTNHKKGISSHQLARDLSITQRTGWYILQRIDEMIKDAKAETLDTQVAVDETYCKGKALNRNKYQKKLIAEGKRIDEPTIVLGMVQKEGKAVFKVVPNAEMETIKPEINKIVQEDTIIVTDAFSSYEPIGLRFKQHIVVNHSLGEYVKDGYSTNPIEGAFSWFKRTIYGINHNVSRKHLQRYCDIFSFRYSTRKLKDSERFEEAMKCKSKRLRYVDLIKKV